MPPKKTAFWSLKGYRTKQFVRHFLACDLDEVEAARRANFPRPEKAGPRLLRRADVQAAIEEQGKDLNLTSAMGREETLRRMSILARDPSNPSYFKALETIGRWLGLNVEKTTLHLDPKAMLEAVEGFIRQLEGKKEVVDAEVVETPAPALPETTD